MTTLPAEAPTEPTTNTEYAAGLRLLADMIDANPDVPISYPDRPLILFYAWNADTLRAVGGAALRAGAVISKEYDDLGVQMKMHFGKLVVSALASRSSVCERVVLGTREVTEEITDPDAPKVTRTRTEEIVEWVCAPGMAGE